MHYISHHRVNAEHTYELYMVQRDCSVLTERFWSSVPQAHMLDVMQKNLLLFCLHFKSKIHLLYFPYLGSQNVFFFSFLGCTGRAENHGVIKGACAALRADLESLIRAGHHMKIPEGKFIYSAFTSTNCNPWYFRNFSESSSHDKPVYLHTSNRD